MAIRFDLLPPNQLGPIVLGCSPEAVERVLGEKLTWEEWMGGNCNHALYYPGLLFEFDACDSRRPLPHSKLISINSEGRHDIYFRERPLGSWQGDELERLLEQEGVACVRHDDWIEVAPWNFEFSLDDAGYCDGFFASCRPTPQPHQPDA